MSPEANKALYRRFLEEVANRGELTLIDQYLSPDFIEHEEMPPGTPAGREGVKHYFREWRTAFPDVRVTVDLEVAEGDLLTCYETWQGTHTAPFVGIPASGNPVLFKSIDIVRIADGKIVEHWGVSDTMTLMQQIGAIPPQQDAE